MILVEVLTELYHDSDMKCQYSGNKVLKVVPEKRKFILSEDADALFAEIHNDFEFNKAQKYENDPFIPGNSK